MIQSEVRQFSGYGKRRLYDLLEPLHGCYCTSIRVLYGGEVAVSFGRTPDAPDEWTLTSRGGDWYFRSPAFLAASTLVDEYPERAEQLEADVKGILGEFPVVSVAVHSAAKDLTIRFRGGAEFSIVSREVFEDLGWWEVFRADGTVVVAGPDSMWALVEGDEDLDAIQLLKAYSLLYAGYGDMALEAFDDLLGETPDDVAVLLGRAAAIGVRGEHERALAALRALATEHSDRSDVLFTSGIAAWNAQAFEEARQFFERVVELAPSWRRAWIELGLANSRLERNNEALRAFEEAVREEPNGLDSNAWRNYGIVLGRLERHAEAERCFRSALRLNRFDAQSWNNLGLCLTFMDRLIEAEEAHRNATIYGPLFPYGWLDLAKLLNNQTRYEEAIRAVTTALAIAPRDVEAWITAATIFTGIGDISSALRALDEAESIDHEDSRIWEVRAETLRRADQLGAANQALARARQLAEAKRRRPDPRAAWDAPESRVYVMA